MKNSFLQQTAQSIIETMNWLQLSHVTFVLPSHRAGLVLSNEILRLQRERNLPTIWAPEVCTLPQLQDYLSPLYAEDELMTIVRLYRLYRAISNQQSAISNQQSAISLDVFYHWGRQMLADFTNIDASMPASEVPNFFENTIAAHELSQWNLEPEVEQRLRALINPQHIEVPEDSIREQYEQVWRQLFVLYKGLRAEMTAEQKGYAGLRQRSVIEHWDEDVVQSKIAGRTYVFVGFNYLLPVERELMEHLRDAQQAVFYWDFVEDFQTNEKAFSFAQRNSSILGNALPPRHWEEPRPVTVMSCSSREAQAQYVHQWLTANYTAKGQHMGIVICDETMLEPVIYALPPLKLQEEDEPAPINITKGFPLRNTQIYSDVLHWLYDRKRGEAEQVITPDFIEQLLSALFPQKPVESENPDTAEEPEKPKGLAWQELLILESEYQVRKIANQMRQLVAGGLGDIPFTLKLLRLLMRRAMESVTMPFHGEPVTDIQVMGVLETRLLDFDNLLILNVEEGVIPQRQNDSSFIPFYLRKAYQMQTSDERATVYAYNFFRLLSRAGHVTILYSEPNNADSCKGKSRFIMQMLVSPDFNVTIKNLEEANTLQPVTFDANTFTFPAFSTVMKPDSVFSPSALNTYITCPYKFALRYIKGVHEPKQKEKKYTPATLGSFVHYTIEYIYKHYFQCDNQSPKRISPDEIERIRTDKACLQEALNYAYIQMKDYVAEEHVDDNILILNYVKNILARDEDLAHHGLQIWMLEKWVRFDVELDEVGTIQLGGKVDRLDIIGPEGAEKIRVVDYKTGSYADAKLAATWDEVIQAAEKDYIRQTLIYSSAFALEDESKRPIEPNLYFCQQAPSEDIQTHIMIADETVSDVRKLTDLFLAILKPKLEEVFTTTQFPKCEEGTCPNYCPYFELCGRKPKEF